MPDGGAITYALDNEQPSGEGRDGAHAEPETSRERIHRCACAHEKAAVRHDRRSFLAVLFLIVAIVVTAVTGVIPTSYDVWVVAGIAGSMGAALAYSLVQGQWARSHRLQAQDKRMTHNLCRDGR